MVSLSAPATIAANSRAAGNVDRRAIGTRTWIPREPEVFG